MTETQNVNSWKSFIDEVINAKNLLNAKKCASRKQFFQGTVLNLFSDENQENLIAQKVNGCWTNMEAN